MSTKCQTGVLETLMINTKIPKAYILVAERYKSE